MSSLHLSGDVVRDVKTYMRNNYHSRNMSIRRIARFLGYDESTLYRRFRAAEGTGVQEYLRRLRLRESTRLLRETDLPVYQVAASVGLEYIPFSRAFRQLQGCTPRDYRKRRPATQRTAGPAADRGLRAPAAHGRLDGEQMRTRRIGPSA
jgi:AraC-like DNA-binding protein